MGIQFGRWNFDGKSVDPGDLKRIRPALVGELPDAEGLYCNGAVGILHIAYNTTPRLHGENPPHVCPSGAVVAWNGRLDNRNDLARELANELPRDPDDLSIIAAAYDKWKADSFARIIGDWAISIWDPDEQSLMLARDFIGVRQLYYRIEKDHLTWCTDLALLIASTEGPLHLDEEYLAGCLAFCPATHVTPYREIRSVPPSSVVLLGKGTERVSPYWDFDPEKSIRYRNDYEYEEHFRVVFYEAVRRRLRSNTPVTAELSGGVDSSSIVCVADDIIGCGLTDTPRLDTLSYYDDSEPNWNERPYFSKVEEKRGRAGYHIDISAVPLLGDFDHAHLHVTPFSDHHPSGATDTLAGFLRSSGSRVLLSGFGGDEVAGGVPTPIPELADLMRGLRLRQLCRQLRLWALSRRQPWSKLLLDTTRSFLPRLSARPTETRQFAPWIRRDFVRRYRRVMLEYDTRLAIFGPRPSFQENIATVNALRRQLGCLPQAVNLFYEKRYPYLDRDLLEFLFAIPRDQHVRPGQRRSLTRRALAGIVPDEVLSRRRKAFVCRAPVEALKREPITPVLLGHRLRIVDPQCFRDCIAAAARGREIVITPALRTAILERWLTHVLACGLINLEVPEAGPFSPGQFDRRGLSNDFDPYQLEETSRERR